MRNLCTDDFLVVMFLQCGLWTLFDKYIHGHIRFYGLKIVAR